MSDDRDPLAPCTDHGCVLRVEPSRGMGTNGGCRCLDGDRFELRQYARRLAADRRRLAEQLRLADALAEAMRADEDGDDGTGPSLAAFNALAAYRAARSTR